MPFPECVLVKTLCTRRGIQLTRYAEDLAALLGVPISQRDACEDSRPGALCVDTVVPRPLKMPTVIPIEEDGVLARGPGPILVPFGNGPSASEALETAANVVAALGGQLIFYHTTWRNGRLSSPDPYAHMEPSARTMLAALEAAAAHHGFSSRSVIELAASVADGVIERALLEGAVLIVTARSPLIGKGSYVDKLAAHSPIPVLVTA